MLSSRRYFRYDVLLPMHMEPVDRYGKQLRNERRQLISQEEEAQLSELNNALKACFKKVAGASSSALYVFNMLNERLDFMWWMLDFIMESVDHNTQNEYKLHLKADEAYSRPVTKKTSSIAPLILGLYDAVNDYILELSSVIQRGAKDKEFSYQDLSQRQFDDKRYVKNLDELAESGVLPAKILQLMIEKINLQAMVLEHLKEAYRKTSSPDEWKIYQINLSPRGCSFLTNDTYPLFTSMDIYMNMDDCTVICRGKVVSQEKVVGELLDTRVGIEFDLLTEEQERLITLFLQHKELKASMAAVALPN